MARGGYRGVGWGACILSPAIFKHVFDAYNFSIFSNLFDSNKPYALSKDNRRCANKMHIFGEARRIKVEKSKQNLPENYPKSTKIAITACKFLTFFRRSMPPDSPSAFLVSQSASNFVCCKNTLEKNEETVPSPLLKFISSPLEVGIYCKSLFAWRTFVEFDKYHKILLFTRIPQVEILLLNSCMIF